MADNFDAVNIIYDLIKDNGVPCYKDKAPDEVNSGSLGEHIVINAPACEKSSYATNEVAVNINIHVKAIAGGYINRSRIQIIRDTVKNLVEAAESVEGFYCVIDRGFKGLIENGKPGYDVFTMRYNLTLNN